MTPDGAVKAIVGGRDYENSQFNRATDASGSRARPSSPSSIWPHCSTAIRQTISWSTVRSRSAAGRRATIPSKYAGRTTLTSALAHSYNSVPVRLMIDIGRKSIIETAHKVGIQGELETWPPMVLGTSALTLLDLTTGYATFAAGGKLARALYGPRNPPRQWRCHLQPRSERRRRRAPRRCRKRQIADLNSMLNAVVKRGTGRRADLGFAPQGGKTGTNQSYRDAWYIGFTAHNVTGVWVRQ